MEVLLLHYTPFNPLCQYKNEAVFHWLGKAKEKPKFSGIIPAMIILGIETSCDETAISVVEAEGDLENPVFKTLSHVVHSQIKDHEPFGGVVPNIAKREHIRNLPLVLIKALTEAGLVFDFEFPVSKESPNENIPNSQAKEFWKEFFKNLPEIKIDLIAVTVGPGLEPALWTGIDFAKELGEKLGVKVIGANHMEGHIASVLLDNGEKFSNKKIEFPAIALLVSGGHTELVHIKNWQEKEKIGETKDDAVGEAFDKVARLLGLPYPGGPQISKLAAEAREKNISLDTKFPRPMIHSGDLNFSFSGLKTAVLYYLKNNPQKQNPLEQSDNFSHDFKTAVAREFEDAAIETLVSKTKDAIEKYNPKSLIVGGGVIANKKLREDLTLLKDIYPDLNLMIPENILTTDNATMIAISGYIDFLQSKSRDLEANGNLSIQ